MSYKTVFCFGFLKEAFILTSSGQPKLNGYPPFQSRLALQLAPVFVRLVLLLDVPSRVLVSSGVWDFCSKPETL